MNLVFNHNYVLKHDGKRTYIYSKRRNESSASGDFYNQSWISKIHPIYAMFFSLATTPVSFEELVNNVSFFFDISNEKAKDIILEFCNRETPFYSKFGGVTSQFPKNVLIESQHLTAPLRHYTPEDFSFKEVELNRERMYLSPMTVVLMPNSNCSTDCAYCYADRRKHAQMELEKMETLIRECKETGISHISLTGGDIFLYKHWKKLLQNMVDNDFDIGLLSTKTPINKEDIEYLKTYNAELQFSLDAASPEILTELLRVNASYLDKVKKCFYELEEAGIQFRVTTVLTNINATPVLMEELYSFIKQFSNINAWHIRIAMKSLYSKKEFDSLKLSQETYNAINEKIKAIKEDAYFEIQFDDANSKHYFEGHNGSKSFKGARCSANYSNIMILPDGKVTICEQLYWNPQFIIGDIYKQKITEIWNSERALQLAFPEQKAFRKSSPCKKCNLFEECYSFPNRCIVDVLKGYGYEYADYPDPRCAKAPKFNYNLNSIL